MKVSVSQDGEHNSNNILYFIIALSEDVDGDSKSF